MKRLPIDALGARETIPGTIEFGLLLPGITSAAGYRFEVLIQHADEHLNPEIPPKAIPLAEDPAGLDGYPYWYASVKPTAGDGPGERWGQPGQYVYRLRATAPDGRVVDHISDPFAREFGIGQFSAITLGYEDHVWSENEESWRTPDIRDLIVYELMIVEFGHDLPGLIDRLDYLRGLGVNCLEIMPVTNVERDERWGYDTIGYFGVDERFGKQRDFKRLVDAAHERGMAIVLDAVYGHASFDFAYQSLYNQLGLESPLNRSGGSFGANFDYDKPLAGDFALTASLYWLEKFHVDGFRYDEVSAYWAGPTAGFATLAYRTFEEVRTHVGVRYWKRFGTSDELRFIQIAELFSPDVLRDSFANGAWQDRTRVAARECAQGQPGAIEALGTAFAAIDYPTVHESGGVTIPQVALQYVENHDHERFACHFGTPLVGNPPHREGDRSRWPKFQPYLIGTLMAKGVPMLWEGEEFGENYFVPDDPDPHRVKLRPVRWHYLFDPAGSTLANLTQRLARIRHEREHLRRGECWFHRHERWQSLGLLLFSRYTDDGFSLVALNFTDEDRTTEFWFTVPGDYREEIWGSNNLRNVRTDGPTQITVPSNYGCVWTHVPSL